MSGLERYEIESEIGRGSMGVVYRAHDAQEDRHVALKELIVAEGITDSRRSEIHERFDREVRAASSLTHPNIAQVYESFTDGDRHFMVMEFLDGQTLREVLEAGPLPPEAASGVAEQILSALDAAHEAGIVHRDIKPDNVFVLDDGTVKVVDFGVAHVDQGDSRLTVAGQVLGTLGYMSPEQIKGDPVDARSDIFAVGVILYETLVGANPFGTDQPTTIMYRISYEEPPALDPFVPDLPGHLTPLIKKAIAKEPDLRYATAKEMLTDLTSGTAPDTSAIDAAIAERAANRAAAAIGSEQPSKPRFMFNPKVAMTVGVVVALLAAGGTGLYLYQKDKAAEEAARRAAIIEEGTEAMQMAEEAKSLLADTAAVMESLAAKADANASALEQWDREWQERQVLYQQRLEEVERHNDLEEAKYDNSYYQYTWFGYVYDSGHTYTPNYWTRPSYPATPAKVTVDIGHEASRLDEIAASIERMRSTVATAQAESQYFLVVLQATDSALAALAEQVATAREVVGDLVVQNVEKGDVLNRAELARVDVSVLEEPFARIRSEVALYLGNFGLSSEDLASGNETTTAQSEDATGQASE